MQQPVRSRRRSRWSLPVSFLAMTILSLAACAGEDAGEGRPTGGERGRPGGGRGATSAIPVKAEPATRAEMTSYIETNARLVAERYIEVMARTQGMVERVIAEEGDLVKAGDILLRLEKEQLSLQHEQARVALEGAQATYERTSKLHARQLVSQEEMENARHQMQTAEVNLKEARLQLDYTDVRASLAGVVMMRDVELGDLVRTNDVVYALADVDPLQVRIRIPEKRMNQVRPGQEARITVDPVPDRVFQGTVKMISPGVDPASGTVKVTLDVPSQGLLRPGMFATVRIVTDRRPDALVVSKKALVLETDEDDVFVVRDGKSRRVRVELGYVDGDRIEVLSGLAEGDQVVTIGHQGLKEDADVRLVGVEVTAAERGQDAARGGR